MDKKSQVTHNKTDNDLTNVSDKIVAYPYKFKYLLLAISAFAFSAVFFNMILAGFQISFYGMDISIKDGYNHLNVALVGLIGFPLCSVSGLYLLYRLIIYKPSLIIDDKGIYDNSSYISAGFIKWSDIESAYLYKFYYNRFLGINLKNNEEFILKYHGLKKFLIQVNTSLAAKCPINIAQGSVNIKLEEVFEIINSKLVDEQKF